MVAKSCVGDCVWDYCGSNLEASKEYRFVKDFFMEKMEGDLLYKEVQQVMHTARGSMCAGWLMGYLTETEDPLEIRKGCKEQLAVAAKHALQMPASLMLQARKGVLMDVAPVKQ